MDFLAPLLDAFVGLRFISSTWTSTAKPRLSPTIAAAPADPYSLLLKPASQHPCTPSPEQCALLGGPEQHATCAHQASATPEPPAALAQRPALTQLATASLHAKSAPRGLHQTPAGARAVSLDSFGSPLQRNPPDSSRLPGVHWKCIQRGGGRTGPPVGPGGLTPSQITHDIPVNLGFS